MQRIILRNSLVRFSFSRKNFASVPTQYWLFMSCLMPVVTRRNAEERIEFRRKPRENSYSDYASGEQEPPALAIAFRYFYERTS